MIHELSSFDFSHFNFNYSVHSFLEKLFEAATAYFPSLRLREHTHTSRAMRPDGPRDPVAGPDSGPEEPFPIKLYGPVIKGFGRGSKDVSERRETGHRNLGQPFHLNSFSCPVLP